MTTATTTMNTASTAGNGGSGRFGALRRTQRNATRPASFNPFTDKVYDRMDFKGTKDPVYVVYDYLDKQPVSKLAADFVKENITVPFKKALKAIAA